MGQLKCSSFFFLFAFLCSEVASSSNSSNRFCPPEERSALLQFKDEFTFSWKSNNTNCCLWDGVTCDRETGHVIELDLSWNGLSGTFHPNSSLFHLNHLQRLDLRDNDFRGSQIPPSIGRFKNLTHLDLSRSSLSGPIPSEISFLSGLVSLDISLNYDLTLEEHDFKSLVKNLTHLEELRLSYVNISSTLPDTFANLSSLVAINLGSTGLRGYITSHIFFLPKLRSPGFGGNDDLKGVFPQGNWTNNVFLTYLNFYGTGFSGKIPDSFGNLKSLSILDLTYCSLSGSVPKSIGNLTEMTSLRLSGNEFIGPIPSTLSNMRQLFYLGLSSNNLTGEIPDSLFQLEDLVILYISDNALTGPLPLYASGLKHLERLLLSNNLLNGTLPPWLFTLPYLRVLNISNNQLTGAIHDFNSAFNFGYLDLSHNYLDGPVPTLPVNISYISISHNKFTGAIPLSVCSLKSLEVLDVAHNELSNTIPECLGNSSSALVSLDLKKNRFHGVIPSISSESLATLNLNDNNFEGTVPDSLAKCKGLEVLDLGNNNLSGRFPHWLESLPLLKVLVLHSNHFHGRIESSRSAAPFPLLRIFDLSNNNFTGHIPASFFRAFSAMRNLSEDGTKEIYTHFNNSIFNYYKNTIELVWKGSSTELVRILTVFTTIDLSSNKFEGRIPDAISMLDSLRSLNLSHNNLYGHIPASMGNLSKLESLDLSCNELTGEIPEMLTSLTFLAVLNLSKNHLVGRIPSANQFSFANDSYAENPDLCGLPLSKVCGGTRGKEPPSTLQVEEEGSSIFDGFTWQVVMLGYGCGTLFGLVLGSLMFYLARPRWFSNIFEKIIGRGGIKSVGFQRRGRRNHRT